MDADFFPDMMLCIIYSDSYIELFGTNAEGTHPEGNGFKGVRMAEPSLELAAFRNTQN